ncbi:hypothetical protein DVJ77_02545 [Dyella tabacisoli]|uniref:Beta-lactamase-related domain-containing protein n=2 Tax=Dyella tabacisoli TaxID=2282381 RepID=A0A369US28_9GAMM|nr:hypothetical protein DVJ77_02545 [Dyella tabacisoli]
MWTGVMQWVEQGKLDLDQDVTIPPCEGKPITLHELVTHTADFEETAKNLCAASPKQQSQHRQSFRRQGSRGAVF